MLTRNHRLLGLVGVLLILIAIVPYLSAVYTPMPRIDQDALRSWQSQTGFTLVMPSRDATGSAGWRVAVVMALSAGLLVTGFAAGRWGGVSTCPRSLGRS
jgi:hypothetical protein